MVFKVLFKDVARNIRAATRLFGNIKAKRRSRGATAHRKSVAKKHREVLIFRIGYEEYVAI